MSHLIDTTEMYLRTIYELIEEGVTPRRARIGERLHHSGPTVSQTVARMERDGLLTLDEDRTILLTESGHRTAVDVMRRHRLVERLLVDVIGLDMPLVHEEACRWEHVVSTAVEERLVTLLEDPELSPFGNPIPDLADSGATAIAAFRDGNAPLLDLLPPAGALEVVVSRIGEYLQQGSSLAALVGVGVAPGARVTAERVSAGVRVAGPSGEAVVPEEAAEHLFVSRDGG